LGRYISRSRVAYVVLPPLNREATLITSGRSQPGEVHHIAERRLDLDTLADDFPRGRRLPSVYVRASGYVLLVAIAVIICYSATL